MPFEKQKQVRPKNKNCITSGYDSSCPHKVYKTNSYGCSICYPPPPVCKYDDMGQDCKCDTECDVKNVYSPPVTYKTKQSIIDHMHTHNLTIDEGLLNFMFK